jgi:hypothetical protein
MLRSTVALLATVALTAPALAQAMPVPPAPFVDLTGIAVCVIGGIFSIVGTVFTVWLQGHMKDQAAAATVSAAVRNSLGAMQQAATVSIKAMDPRLPLPTSVPPDLAVGVQYVLDHAGDEAKRLGVTKELIASKVSAQIGLANIATNQATAASDAPSPAPLDPVALPPPVASIPVHIVAAPLTPIAPITVTSLTPATPQP